MGQAFCRRQVPVRQSRLLENAITEIVKQMLHARMTERCYRSDDRPRVVCRSESVFYLRNQVKSILAFD